MDYIIEIALNKYTDFNKFEELATRILNDEGYDSIRAIGGVADKGIDGEETRYYHDGTKKTIFQYSLDKRNRQKLIDTIEKLKENAIQFESIVFVTINQINNTEKLRSDIRKHYKNAFQIDIVERKTILSRLAANNYSLFNIYFPNIRSQIESTVFNKKVYFSDETADVLQTSLLKCSLLFTFNRNAQSTRKDLFDRLILSVIASANGVTTKDILNTLNNKYSRSFSEDQIKTSALRLVKQEFVNNNNQSFSASKRAIEYIEGSVTKIEQSTDALINDIVDKVIVAENSQLDRATIAKVKSNVKKSLSAFFRLHGVDYTNSHIAEKSVNADFGFEKNKALIDLTKEGLSERIGTALTYSIGDTIQNPTDEQAETLSHWAKAFIGLQILNLDPALKEFQATNFSKKTFIIDTDFLLNCLVEECELSKIYRRLVKQLKVLNCKMIISPGVIAEVIKHGEAENNYTYFRATFKTVDENIVNEKIHNVFVKGYYLGLLHGSISQTTTFKTYLSNYIHKDAPYQFIVDLIEQYFPNTFIFEELSTTSQKPLDQELLEKLTNLINDQTKNTFKAQWRSEDENREVSLNDAKMYLITYFLNEQTSHDPKAILPGKYYLLTSSTRAARCGLRINLTTSISVKPETLISLLDQLGSFEISSKEFVNVFENPYLVEVANECWTDIKTLIDAGVDLRDKNPVNLRYELKDTIHSYLIERNKYENNESQSEEKQEEEVEFSDFIQFARHVKAKGYKFTPSIEQIIGKFKEMQTDIKEKDKAIKELRETTVIFGRRKQKYLDKIANANKRK
ncbi:MAG: hypothetical protein HOP08_18815 [Cyclobacteriaceae bacterium]|nr:hypothetical protein [Cyclobacteriaceae bacterium]